MTEKERKKLMDAGILRPLSKAFKDYPVEEEIHQGRADYYICEKSYQSEYEIGDIVFAANFYYPNGTKGKDHLFALIDKDFRGIDLEYNGMLISSNLKKVKYKENKLLEKNRRNGLQCDSILKTDFIYRIDPSSILFKIGRLDEHTLHDVLLNCREANHGK